MPTVSANQMQWALLHIGLHDNLELKNEQA